MPRSVSRSHPPSPADDAAREALGACIDAYSDEKAAAWLRLKFPSFGSSRTSAPPLATKNDREFFSAARLLGFVKTLPDSSGTNRPLVVVSVRMRRPLSERTSRLVQFDYARRVVKEAFAAPPPGLEGLCSQGLFFFHDDCGDFRLSFVSCRTEGRRIVWSEARRHSFFCRSGRRCNTMRKRLGDPVRNVAELEKAFSVEELTKDFYKRLFAWYEWALNPATHVSFPNRIGDRTDDRKKLPEAIIRLITRLLFVWFVRERGLVPGDLFDREKLDGLLKRFRPEAMDDPTYYRAVLQNLFFATLNVPPEERKWSSDKQFQGKRSDHNVAVRFRFREAFRDADAFFSPDGSRPSLLRGIPFLNCALFDCLDRKAEPEDGRPADSENDVYLDGFSRHPRRQAFLPNALFFGDGSGREGREGLIPLLDAYEFTIDENAASDGDIALDPELLGKVFENLLGAFNPETQEAARKMTGSFYTPREIVDYMVDQSLRAHLRAKVPAARDEARLDDLFARSRQPVPDDSGLLFTRTERTELLEALYDCRTLDPACGSGAFPMGLLHAMTRLLAVLDPDGRAIQERVLRRHREDLLTLSRDDRIERAEREKRTADLEKMLAEQTANPDYARKLWIIENCIYGVDIQPIAAQISKLRFYISLLCDQPDADASSFVALPNLESKFVCANTLLPLPDVGGEFDFSGGGIPRLRSELREIRHRIFQARGWKTKRDQQAKEKAKRAEIAEAVSDSLCQPDKVVVEREERNLRDLETRRAAVEQPLWRTRKKPRVQSFEAALFGEETMVAEEPDLFERYDANAEKRDEIDRCIANSRRVIDRENAKKNRRRGNSAVEDLANLVAAWDPYDQNASADFFDPDWMFDVKDGFDIVIGNPPYVLISKDEYNEKYANIFHYQSGKIDLYRLFIEIAFSRFAKETTGSVAYITPNTFLSIPSCTLLRKMLIEKHSLRQIINFTSDVFDSACVNNVVFIASTAKPTHESEIEVLADGFQGTRYEIPYQQCRNEGYSIKIFANPDTEAILSKMRSMSTFETLDAEVCLGVQPYHNSIHTKKQIASRFLHSDRQVTRSYMQELGGRDVFKYAKLVGRGVWLDYSRDLYMKPDIRFFTGERIVLREIPSETLIATLTASRLLVNKSCYIIRIPDDPVLLRYVLAILNSRAIGFWVANEGEKANQTLFPRITMATIKKLPIPLPKTSQQHAISTIVDRVLFAKAADPTADTSTLENRIDKLVYKLYGLTDDEIAIVEGRDAEGRKATPAVAADARERTSVLPAGADSKARPSGADDDYLE